MLWKSNTYFGIYAKHSGWETASSVVYQTFVYISAMKSITSKAGRARATSERSRSIYAGGHARRVWRWTFINVSCARNWHIWRRSIRILILSYNSSQLGLFFIPWNSTFLPALIANTIITKFVFGTYTYSIATKLLWWRWKTIRFLFCAMDTYPARRTYASVIKLGNIVGIYAV